MNNIKICILFITLAIMAWSCAPEKNFRKISVADYQDKVYASWLGQVIGNIYGLPHENAYIDAPGEENFPYGYSDNLEWLREINGAFSDDDTDIEYMYLLAMEEHGIEPTLKQLADKWKYHVRKNVWLANRAALSAMHYGYTPPATGWASINPHWFQIDPQLINEIWSVTAPGMIDYAVEKSKWAATIMDDKWGLEPTMHYAAMYSAAFFESDINKLIDIGTAVLPTDSKFAKTVVDMKSLYGKYPDDWKKAREEMAEKYYINESEESKTIWNANLNGACSILALLYGKGDFQNTLDLSCAMGFDADNQAATMSGLLGVIIGTEGLPKNLVSPIPGVEWEKPFNDTYKNFTRHDMPDASLEDMARRMAVIGDKIILKYDGKKVIEDGIEYYLIDPEATFTFPVEFPSVPMPIIEAEKPVDYQVYLLGGKSDKWQILDGAFPEGLTFINGKISGQTSFPGVFPITLQVELNNQKYDQDFIFVSRGENLAQSASGVLANVKETNTEIRDSMWLTVSRSLYAPNLEEIIRDGNRLGEASTFYSISDDINKMEDFFGYEWESDKEIGLVAYHTGSVEESSGWFTSLNVEYKDNSGQWKKVEDLVISPSLPGGDHPFDKPNFVEYLLAFKLVNTKAIRMIGTAGIAEHWITKPYRFTSITELSIYGALPDYDKLRR